MENQFLFVILRIINVAEFGNPYGNFSGEEIIIHLIAKPENLDDITLWITQLVLYNRDISGKENKKVF